MSGLGIRQSSSISYIPGLDGVRAIAVLAVVLCHYSAVFTQPLRASGNFWNVYSHIANLGWVGVDIFFVISGFLIAKMLMRKPVTDAQQYGHFIKRRAWRLLPAYLVCLLIFSTIAVLYVPHSKVLNNSMPLWTMTSNIQSSFISRSALMDGYFSLIHFWSLAVEWHFYLLLPLLLFILRSIWVTALLLIVLSVATRYVFQHFGTSDNAIYSFTLCRLDALAIGSLLAVFHNKISDRLVPAIAMIGFVAFVTMMASISLSEIPYKKIPWLQLAGYSLIPVSVAMMLALIINRGASHPITRLLEARPMVAVGRASYSLYIWHLVFFPAIANAGLNIWHNPLDQFMGIFILASAYCGLATWASFRFVESRFYLFSRTH